MKKSAKFERCVLAVKAKQSKRCKSKNWKGKGCVNPWAVCHSSIDGILSRKRLRSKKSRVRKSATKKSRRRKL